ncbi:hypothetical protein [Agrobacterium vitis]|uniref:hypothetical protein n=1 Tax=Agrobacterium vitis TaxID=373 RepID=UPI002035016B|nr:hypothetical protein [Agrobacterium vitis]MCM2453458.1 hypothetical protein [Agrobacterium vitis]
MTGFQQVILFLMASFAVYLLVQPFMDNWGQTLRKRVCLFKEKWSFSFYLNVYTTKKSELIYTFSGTFDGYFSRQIEPQHMKLLIEKIRILHDDIETGSYYVSRPYQAKIGDNKRGKLYFGPTFTVFKRYGFVSYLSEENEQKYHNDLFDIFICDAPKGHFAVFKPLGGPEVSPLIRFSLLDMKKTCEQVLEAFEKDFAES